MKYQGNTLDLTLIAILAACNAVLELTIGNYLHVIKFPLTGLIMVGINIIIYTIGYSLVPRKGVIFSMGILTALINLFFGGSFKPWSLIAIVAEAGIIEIIISRLGLSFWSVMVASITSNVFSFFYSMAVVGIILGRDIVERLVQIAQDLIFNSQWAATSIFTFVLLLIAVHIGAGALFGSIAWKIKQASFMSLRSPQSEQVLE